MQSDFSATLKAGQITQLAGLKTFNSAAQIIGEYNSCLESGNDLSVNFGLSQEGLIKAVSQSNLGLANYLSSLNGTEASIEAYGIKMVLATAKTYAFRVALNALVGMGTMVLSLAFSKIASEISEAKKRAEELREEIQSLGEEAVENTNEILDLYEAYKDMAKAYRTNSSLKSDLRDSTEELLLALGYESDEIDALIDKYGDINDAIESTIENALLSNLITATAAYNDSADALAEAAKKRYSIGLYGDDVSIGQALEALTGDSLVQTNITEGGSIVGGSAIYTYRFALDVDTSSAEGVRTGIEQIQVYQDALTELVNSGEYSVSDVTSSKLYLGLVNILNQLQEEYDAYLEDLESTNAIAASLEYQRYINDYGVPSTQAEYNSMREAVLAAGEANGEFVGSLEDAEAAVDSYLSSLSELEKFSSNYSTAITSLQDILDSLDLDLAEAFAGTDTDTEALNSEIAIFTEYANEYITKANELSDALDKYRNNALTQDELGILLESFPELADDTDELGTAIISLLGEMDTKLIQKYLKQFGNIDTEDGQEALYSLLDAILAVANTSVSLQFDVDIDTETEGIEALLDALEESASAAGLASDSVSALKSRYSELEDFNAAKLFELTANGIHLNVTELKSLEKEYKSKSLSKAKTDLASLMQEYNDLSTEIKNCSNASERNSLYSQQSSLRTQIEEVATLATQYESLTSKYNSYLDALDSTNEREMYETIIDGYEDVEDLISRGWIDDDVRAYLDLLTFEDLSTAGIEDVISAWKSLGNAIEGTTYSKLDFFTTDENGNSTSQGVQNLYDAILQLQELYNKTWAWTDEDGLLHLDFGVGGDDTVAEALGLSTEALQSLLRALAECSDFDVVLDNEYTQYLNLTTAIEECNEALNDALTLKNADWAGYIFNVDSSDVSDIQDQIDELNSILANYYITDGVFNINSDGATEAYNILLALNAQKATLASQVIMGVDTAGMTGDIYSAIDMFKEAIVYFSEIKTNLALGLDTSDANDTLLEYLDEIESLDAVTRATLNFNDEAFLTAVSNIRANIEAGLSVDATDLTTIQSYIGSIDAETLVSLGVDDTLLQDYLGEDYSSTVVWGNDTSSVDEYIATEKKAYGKVYWSNASSVVSGASSVISGVLSGLLGQADGTMNAHAQGTDVSIKKDETAIVNELGEEGLIRNGIFTRIKGGLQTIRLKAGDIILNHKQMRELDKNGRVTSNGGRGKLIGHAFSNGTTNAYSNALSGSSIFVGVSSSSYSLGKTSSSSSSGSDGSDSEVIDWIEIAIDRIERAISNFATTAESAYRSISDKLSATNKEINSVVYEIELQQLAYERYMKEAASVGLSSDLISLIQNGAIDISEYSEDVADLIEEYQKWYEKALDCSDAIAELTESLGDLYASKFSSISETYENELALIEHLATTYENAIDDAETRGYLVSTKYYEALKKVEQETISVLETQLVDLALAMSEAVNSGSIEEGSSEWYEMQQSINSVKESLQEATTALVEYENAMRDLEWDYFDYLQEQISNISTEADFLIDLMSNTSLYTANGQLTDTGLATMALHGENYNVYMAQADKYAQEILTLDEEIANDPYNTDLLERRQELLEAQQDAILAAEEEKQAIISLVEDGIELELDALSELIDSYTDALDSAKDLYDYQKKIKEQTSEIASLQKQIAAYSGDTSEETKATIQKLQVSLAEAQADLEETQYEQYISDAKKLLNNLYDEYEAILNQRLDDVDALLSDMIDTINANSATISDTLVSQAEAVGYSITDSLTSIWANDGEATSVIAKYCDSFTSQLTSVNSVLNAIAFDIASMTSTSDDIADATISSASSTTDVAATEASSSGSSSSSASSSSSSSSSSSLSDTTKQGVAAAIWIYGGSTTGWGTGATRTSRLTEKFGASGAAAIQSYISAHGSNGDLYKYWTNAGKSKLTNYYYSAFKKGGLADYTGVAWLDGTPSEPELVLNAEDTANFIALKDILQSIANGDSSLASAFATENGIDLFGQLTKLSIPSSLIGGTSIGTVSYEINIPIDHVSDYEDFMNQMRSDDRFENLIQSMTIDRLVGGSKIAKNKYSW